MLKLFKGDVTLCATIKKYYFATKVFNHIQNKKTLHFISFIFYFLVFSPFTIIIST